MRRTDRRSQHGRSHEVIREERKRRPHRLQRRRPSAMPTECGRDGEESGVRRKPRGDQNRAKRMGIISGKIRPPD